MCCCTKPSRATRRMEVPQTLQCISNYLATASATAADACHFLEFPCDPFTQVNWAQQPEYRNLIATLPLSAKRASSFPAPDIAIRNAKR